MTVLLYSLSFIPILLITLVAHELGHLIAARIFKIKLSGFHIGIGPPLFTTYTGNTHINLDNSTHTPSNIPFTKGQIILAYVTQDPSGAYLAEALIPFKNHRQAYLQYPEDLRRYNAQSMQLTGRIKSVTNNHIVLADVKWSLRMLPIMAGVFLPEDPTPRIQNAYNHASWPKKTLVTLAGPAANIVLLIAVIATMALIPSNPQPTPVLTVTQVVPDSPAHHADIQIGDRIIQAGHTLIPTGEQLRQKIDHAAQEDKPITILLSRSREHITLNLTPDRETHHIGLSLTPHIQTRAHRPYSPSLVTERFTRFTHTYFGAIPSLASAMKQNTSNHAISGPIVAAYYTAQAIQYAQFKAWLAILATITLTTALLNMAPFPPLDGYRLVVHSIEALRHSKPINPKLERAMIFSGLAIIATASTYLVLIDLIQLLH